MSERSQIDRVKRRLELLLARAVARQEFAAVVPTSIAHRALFIPLAASSGSVAIYGEMTADDDSLLKIKIEAANTEILITIGAIGFVRTNILRNKTASLRSEDGEVNFAFRFDSGGRAEFALTKSNFVEEALSHGFAIEVFDD